MEFKTQEERQEWKKFLRTLNTRSASDRVLMMRERCELTQKQLADIVGCSHNVIKEMELGNILNKRIEYVHALCNYFECSVDWLLCENNLPVFDPKLNSIADYLRLSPDAADQLVSVLRKLGNDTDRQIRRGLNHLISADPDALSDLCFSLEEFISFQRMKLEHDNVNDEVDARPLAQFYLGNAWKQTENIFMAAYKKDKEFRQTEEKEMNT